ncbi:hypothetical protein CY34DRAFT_814578 [Suillus luteus UH-Slu-Lm8-n1]|uniref:Uncharacterized protein n=1 Tax=Suillus luteus UH-Slu-Lm8-n1 TaxID=930992 RepID=A0A0D0ABC1_9AGAM|nr:hypothetical protein CY34DRAFT_814578 [Suillus luteus UH-Slu-Lm8-n1]
MSIHNAPSRTLPPLAYPFDRLSIGKNRLTDEVIPPFTILKELRVLNLSFNSAKVQCVVAQFLYQFVSALPK